MAEVHIELWVYAKKPVGCRPIPSQAASDSDRGDEREPSWHAWANTVSPSSMSLSTTQALVLRRQSRQRCLPVQEREIAQIRAICSIKSIRASPRWNNSSNCDKPSGPSTIARRRRHWLTVAHEPRR